MAVGGLLKARSVVLITALSLIVGLLSVFQNHGLVGTAHAQTTVTVDTVGDLELAVASAVAGDVILIEPDTYELTNQLVIVAPGVTIEGLGAKAVDVRLVAANNKRVLLVSATGAVVRNVSVADGRVGNAKGGGIHVETGAELDLIDVEVVTNFADEGGGLFNAGVVRITGSLFEDNDARRKGGAIENDGFLTVVNSTLADNEGKGGGGLSTAGTASLSFVTVFSNRSTNKIGAGTLRNGGTLAVKNSIVANNVGSDGDFHDCSGTPDFDNVIVTSDQGCNPEGTYDVYGPAGVVEGLPPVDNGGPTRTLALLDLSPAIDYTTDCLDLDGVLVEFDQRGVARDTTCDLGAYELIVDETAPVVSLSLSPDPNADDWHGEALTPVTVSIAATDDVSEISSIEYQIDGGAWTAYVDPLILCGTATQTSQTCDVTAEGTVSVGARATDTAGNTSVPVSADPQIDTIAPSVGTTQTPGTEDGDVLLTMTATDATSGVQSVEYSVDGGTTWANQVGTAAQVEIVETGIIQYRATDVAGNTNDAESITVTIEPLSFDISMATSVSQVEVGAVIVPVENIGEAIQAAAGAGTSVSSTPLSSIPLSSIPLSSIPLSSIPLSSIPLSSIPLSSIPLSSIPLSSIPLSSIPLSSIPLSSIGGVIDCTQISCPEDAGLEYLLMGTPLQGTPLQALNFVDLVSVPLSSIPLSSIPLSSIPLSSIPLSSIPLSSIGSTIDCGLVPGGCEDPNTLEDAFIANAITGGTVGDVLAFDDVTFGATPLSSIPLSSIALGTTPLSSIPLSSILVGADPAAILAEWCEVLDLVIGSDGCNLVEADGTSLMTLALGGIPLSSIPLSSVPLSSIPLSSIPLSSIPLSSIAWTSTPLSSIPLSSIPLSSIPLSSIPLSSIPLASIGNLVDCLSVDCTNGTIGQAAASDAFLVDTLGDLGPYLVGAAIGDLEGLGDLDGFSLADLLFGLLAPTEIPWEEIDLNASRLPDAADPKQPAFTYDIELVVGGARSAEIDVVLTPPEGFYIARDLSVPTTLDDVQVADPVEDLASGELSLTLAGVSPGTHTLSIAMRAGIVLGDHEASATADATTAREGPLPAGPATASINVIESGENGGGGGAVPTLIDGELNLSHISRSDDLDFYEFIVGENLAGSSAKILLSNLPADYDLVLYGPPVSAPLRGDPQPGFGLVEDFVFDLSPDDEVLDTDTLQDVAHDPAGIPGSAGEVLNSISAKRGSNDEEIDTGALREGRYVVQVSSYNGAFNDLPFGLRIRLSETAQRACNAPAFTLGTRGTLPINMPTDINTLFLYNHARLTSEYPSVEAQQVLSELARISTNVWTSLGVIGLVVPVDGDGAVWSALNDLAADRCNPEASNNVVRAIGNLIDSYPEVENIVIIGDDAQIPMARILDGTAISNEREHGLTFTGNNELVGALLGGYFLSDGPYGTSAGIAVNDHEFFVPERAVGRLVEHPADIAQSLVNYVTFEGLLDSSTAAVASGYDFLSDGTDLIKSELEGEGFGFGAGDLLNNETWTRLDLINLLDGGPLVASINAHFDQSRALPADGNSSGTESDLFTIADLPATFDEAVLFSMGCHAGLSVSDVQVGAPSGDWAETIGGIWSANTGYGYGDTKLVALSEQITANFASRLGSFSVGKAWQLALQEYAGDLFTLTPYDEKVLQEFTLYGLPMYLTGPAAAATPNLPPVAGTGPGTFVDPFTALQTASISFDLPLSTSSGAGLHLVTTPDGDYFEVGGETLQVRSRPVQPLTGTDITVPDGLGGLESVAGGALITGLTGVQMTNFDPMVFTPVVDLADGSTSSVVDAHRPEAADATFPTGIQRVSTFEDDSGQVQQRLLVVPGRFVAQGPGGIPTQELFTAIDAQVYYRANPTDFTAPFIRESIGRYGDDVVHFEVEVEGGDVEPRLCAVPSRR